MSSSAPDAEVPHSKSQLPGKTSWWSRQSLWKKILLVLISLLVIIGLAVGLGVGLTVGNNGDSSSSSPSPSPLPPYRLPNGTVWQPSVNSSWQIILQNPLELSADAISISPNVSIFDIDMFTNNKTVVDGLHRLGKKVICYFSAGSYEPDRPDSSDFHSSDKGKELDGWPGEYWLNLSSSNVRDIMKKRMDVAVQKGCDAIDPDNVDGYDNDNGLGLTQDDSVEYMRFLATEAQSRNLTIGLKNADAIIPKVLSIVQFSVNEQCVEYSECMTYAPFIDAGKPVFHIEYPDGAPKLSASTVTKYCSDTGDGDGAKLFSTVLKTMDLDGWVEYCNRAMATTSLDTT
ncbi:hypothetical protein NA57DRAFT_39725 [Rhizodiscina lignyota]|uniref:alpha-galactosidase n=1 Tax=Rhizodiscina lignyota TaxID=1504668 RepID=A0A9P4IGT6_9PEZI|nr:hypothetical protein NA57DRAFT_39725 [Rhizodiscina lignyota]